MMNRITNMRMRLLAAGFTLLCLGAQVSQALTINVSVANLRNDTGAALPDGATVMLVADTAGDGFGNLTSASSASATSFVNDADDDVIVKRFPLDSATAGTPGGHVESIQFTLGDEGIVAGSKLLLVWYVGLSEFSSPTAPGECRKFGTYRTDSSLDGSTGAWVVPSNNAATLELNMVLQANGGSLANTEGNADQVTTGTCGTTLPPTAICKNVTVVAGSNCQTSVAANQVDNGSFDTDGTIVGRSLNPVGPFSVGQTAVTLTVTDDDGATASCSATITVVDQTPPSVTCPGNRTITLPEGQTQTNVTFTATATDNCGIPSVVCVPASGSTFSVGTATVTCTATDQATLTGQCSFQVTVNPTVTNDPPTALCRNVTVTSTNGVNAVVTATQVDNGSFDTGGSIVNRVLSPSGPYPVGDTLVTLTVTDNLGATGICSSTITVNTTPTKPAAPSSLSVLAIADDAILVSWSDMSNNETGFKIQRATSSTGPWTSLPNATANLTLVVSAGLQPEKVYFYRLAAFNAVGKSAWVGPVSTKTQKAGTPDAPSDLTVTAVGCNQVNLSWTDNSNNETAFKIKRQIMPGGDWLLLDIVNAGVTSYTDTDVLPGVEYCYRVQAKNNAGNSKPAPLACSTTPLCGAVAALNEFPLGAWEIMLLGDQPGMLCLTFDEAGDVTGNGMLPGSTEMSFISGDWNHDQDGQVLSVLLRLSPDVEELLGMMQLSAQDPNGLSGVLTTGDTTIPVIGAMKDQGCE